MVYCAGLENRRAERLRGFESHPLRTCEADQRDCRRSLNFGVIFTLEPGVLFVEFRSFSENFRVAKTDDF